MNRKEYLQIVRKQIHFIFDRDSIEAELDQHLSDSIADLVEEGFAREEAERIAVEQMGDPVETGKMLNQEHHPVLGYLWMASKAVLVLVAIPATWYLILGLWMLVDLMFPEKYDVEVVSYPLNIECEMSTHHLKLDSICQNEFGDYYITYRAWRKYEYSRADCVSSELFYFESDEGELEFGGYVSTSGLGGTKGSKHFEWPEDNILCVVDRDGNKIEIDLEEYCDESREKTN